MSSAADECGCLEHIRRPKLGLLTEGDYGTATTGSE